VLKEFDGEDGGTFKCENMQHSKLASTVTVYGWFECEIVEQNF